MAPFESFKAIYKKRRALRMTIITVKDNIIKAKGVIWPEMTQEAGFVNLAA